MIAMTLGNGFDDSSAFMKSQTLDCLASLSGSRISSVTRRLSFEIVELFKLLFNCQTNIRQSLGK